MNAPREDTIHLPEDLAALLERLATELRGLYGERYRGLVLYGSYARGEADEGSDVDLLLLEGEVDSAEEVSHSQEVAWPLSLETGYVLSIIPIGVEKYRHSKQPFLWNARDEGVILA